MEVKAWLERCPLIAILRGIQPATAIALEVAKQFCHRFASCFVAGVRGSFGPPWFFGAAPDVCESPAPKFEAPLARMALAERSTPALQTPASLAPATFPVPTPSQPATLNRANISPSPPLRTSVERSSQPLTRAPAGPPSGPAKPQPAAPTSGGDPDAAYRDLLSRVREEREQLGQLISHPF